MKVYLFIVFSCFYCSINAQSVVVAVDKMNVFYLGVDNPIDVAVEGVANEKLKISTDNGEIIQTKQGQYIVHPENAGICNIIVEWNRQRILKTFRVKPIPDPKIHIGSARPEGHLSTFKNSLHLFKGLIALLANFDFDAKCSVVSYTCTCIFVNGEVKNVKVIGHVSNEVVELLKKVDDGDKVIFNDIQVKCPGDKVPRKMEYEISRVVK